MIDLNPLLMKKESEQYKSHVILKRTIEFHISLNHDLVNLDLLRKIVVYGKMTKTGENSRKKCHFIQYTLVVRLI